MTHDRSSSPLAPPPGRRCVARPLGTAAAAVAASAVGWTRARAARPSTARGSSAVSDPLVSVHERYHGV